MKLYAAPDWNETEDIPTLSSNFSDDLESAGYVEGGRFGVEGGVFEVMVYNRDSIEAEKIYGEFLMTITLSNGATEVFGIVDLPSLIDMLCRLAPLIQAAAAWEQLAQ